MIYLALYDLAARVGSAGVVVRDSIASAGAVFLALGLWTPVTAAVAAVDQVWIAISPGTRPACPMIHFLLAVLAAALAMLGPGSWSMDARLFGRKRFDLRSGNRAENNHPKSGPPRPRPG